MTLEVRIPISAEPSWINRTCLAIQSVRRFYQDAFFRISVSPKAGMSMDFPRIKGVTWKVVAKDRFDRWAGTRSEYLETMMDRYTAPLIGDHILMLDGDVLCVGPFPELFEVDAISGVQAHVPPFGVDEWMWLFRGFRITETPKLYEHSGWGAMAVSEATRYSPAYFNSGVVFGPRNLLERLAEPYAQAIDWMRRLLRDSYWFDQTGLALGLAKASIPVNVVGLRYNFPNDARFDIARPDELADIKFIHYLREGKINRVSDFESLAALHRLVQRDDLSGSHEALRRAVAANLSILEPNPLTNAEDVPWA